MKPLNEKERTLAFVQFLVLFILTIIVTIWLVFFDVKIAKTDYEVLKAENRKLKEEKTATTELPNQIDSLTKVVMGFNSLPLLEYNSKVQMFNDDLERIWSISADDTSSFAKSKDKLGEVFKKWSYSMAANIKLQEINDQLKESKNETRKIQEKYDDLIEQFNTYRLTHQ